MKVAVLQPSFLPWLGHLDQYAWSDRFVLYDDVQYDKHGWRNRNRILTANGIAWLSIPVRVKGKDFPLINEVQVDYATPWRRKHLESLRQAYSKAPHFDWLYPQLQDYYAHDWPDLLSWDVEGLKMLSQLLGIAYKGVLSSSLGVDGRKTERLVGICRVLGATDYLTGDAARDYLEESQFEQIGVKVHWHGYPHPTYAQRPNWSELSVLRGATRLPLEPPANLQDFVPYLSVIDLLFGSGPDSLKILWQTRT